MSIEEKRRELFEAWFKQTKPRVAQEMMDDDEFVVRWMFEAYCAALDAVVIELPGERRVRKGWAEASGADMAFNDCRELCIDAIESTGLGLKVLP